MISRNKDGDGVSNIDSGSSGGGGSAMPTPSRWVTRLCDSIADLLAWCVAPGTPHALSPLTATHLALCGAVTQACVRVVLRCVLLGGGGVRGAGARQFRSDLLRLETHLLQLPCTGHSLTVPSRRVRAYRSGVRAQVQPWVAAVHCLETAPTAQGLQTALRERCGEQHGMNGEDQRLLLAVAERSAAGGAAGAAAAAAAADAYTGSLASALGRPAVAGWERGSGSPLPQAVDMRCDCSDCDGAFRSRRAEQLADDRAAEEAHARRVEEVQRRHAADSPRAAATADNQKGVAAGGSASSLPPVLRNRQSPLGDQQVGVFIAVRTSGFVASVAYVYAPHDSSSSSGRRRRRCGHLW